MNKNPTVYVVNKSGHDYSDAERYGKLHFITEGTLDRFNVNNMHRICSDTFQTARPNDYILITSLTILCAVACATFAQRFNTLNLLIFKDGKYIERRLIL